MKDYIRLANFNDNQQFYKFEYQMRRKEMTEEERIKEDVEMEQHIKIETEKISKNRIKIIRDRRDELLAKSDYYFNVPDIKIIDEKKEQILKYRQELRDFPSKIIDGMYDDKFHILSLTMDDLLGHLPKL